MHIRRRCRARAITPIPLRLCSISRAESPILRTSAPATPSGYGRSDPVTSARRNGIEYMTPRIPPSAHTAAVVQYGNPLHQPIMSSAGNTKMIDDSVPAADAIV